MTKDTKASATLVSTEEVLKAKESVIKCVREFLRIGHEGEVVSGDLQTAGKNLVEALHKHDELLGIG